VPKLVDLDPVYFADEAWARRLARWLANNVRARTFLDANAEAVDDIAKRRDLGLRMAVNIPAYALLLFLKQGQYKNAYERAPRIGKETKPSETRLTVDRALFPTPPPANERYFGAAVLGGAGVRYYGDYCVVLKEESVSEDTQVLDRNSYDAVFPPLKDLDESLDQVMDRLRGQWAADLVPMAKLKILPELGASPRLATGGAASETLLHDESFVEIHKHRTFGPADVHEVRESAADAAVEADLTGRRNRGHALSTEEMLWLYRRHAVDRLLAARGIRARIIVTAGRTPR
jgi:hypothetical protein